MLTGRYVYFPNHIDDLILSSRDLEGMDYHKRLETLKIHSIVGRRKILYNICMATDWGHRENVLDLNPLWD